MDFPTLLRDLHWTPELKENAIIAAGTLFSQSSYALFAACISECIRWVDDGWLSHDMSKLS